MYLHTCGHDHRAASPAESFAGGGGAGRNKRRLTVDMHCHVIVPEVELLVKERPEKLAEPGIQVRMMGAASVEHNNRKMLPEAFPRLTSLEHRLRDMDEMGVDIQVISPTSFQHYYWADVDLARQVVRICNDKIAELCARHPDRLAALGNVALQHPELAVEQLEYCVRKLGMHGVEVSTSINGRELDDPGFERFWAKAEELGCLVFIHPFGTSLGERVNRFYLANIIGQPIETTIALSHLIFGGVLDRYPGVKICAAHGGGYLPSYIGRSDHGHRVRPEAQGMQRPPSEYLRQIWFDTLVYTPQALAHLISQVGVSQVVVGTDYPFDMGAYDVHALVDAVPGLSEQERVAILGGNALRLLGRLG
jgi:aminocarboxymuconate-semialdehyde decarboxylase